MEQVTIEREQLVEILRSPALDFFASFTLPDVLSLPFPPIYHALWKMLTEASDECAYGAVRKFALGLPRGHAKTTFLKLVIARNILLSHRSFFLVVCASERLAENFIADIADILDSPNVVATFGNWRLGMEIDRQDLKKFPLAGRDVVLAGLGAGSSMRGLNLKHKRPDFVVLDDVQTRECANSPTQSQELLVWMLGTLMKLRDPRGCVYAYLGNMYPTEYAILRKLRDSSSWTSLIVGAILADGSALWPQLRSLDSLYQELADDMALGHPELFFAEVLNDDTAIGVSGLDVSRIPQCPYSPSDPPDGKFLVVDPSAGKSDPAAIGLFYVYDTKPVCIDIFSDVLTPKELVRHAIEMALRHGVPLIAIEDVGQSTFVFWFEEIAQQIGLTGVSFIPITPRGASKSARIRTMFQMLMRGEIYLTPAVRQAALSQAAMYNPLRRDNRDDILDVLAYAPEVLAQYNVECAQLLPFLTASYEEASDAIVTCNF